MLLRLLRLWLLVLLKALLTVSLLSVLLVLSSLWVAVLLILSVTLLAAVLGIASILLAVAVLAVALVGIERLCAWLEGIGAGCEGVAAACALLEVQTLLGLVGEVLIVHLVLPRVGGAVGHVGWYRGQDFVCEYSLVEMRRGLKEMFEVEETVSGDSTSKCR